VRSRQSHCQQVGTAGSRQHSSCDFKNEKKKKPGDVGLETCYPETDYELRHRLGQQRAKNRSQFGRGGKGATGKGTSGRGYGRKNEEEGGGSSAEEASEEVGTDAQM